MAGQFEDEEIEVFNEEVVTLSAIQLWTGKLQVEMRVLGRLRIGDQMYHWDKVVCVPLHPIDEDIKA
jgi:hypothetical protein